MVQTVSYARVVLIDEEFLRNCKSGCFCMLTILNFLRLSQIDFCVYAAMSMENFARDFLDDARVLN